MRRRLNLWLVSASLLPLVAWCQTAAHLVPPSLAIHPASFWAAENATVADIKIDDARGQYGAGPLHITYSDGAQLAVGFPSFPAKTLGATVGISSPVVADNKRTVAWVEDVGWCCASYPLPHILDVFRGGRFLLRIAVPSMIYDFKILPGSNEVVVHWGFPHGAYPETVELYSLKSGKKLGQASTDRQTGQLAANAPSWAETYLAKVPE